MEFANDIGINWKDVWKLNLADAKRRKTEAYKELQRIEKDCPEWRNEFTKSRKEEVAKEKGVPVAKIIAQEKRKKGQKNQGSKGRRVTGKGLKEPVQTALIKSPDGSKILYNSQSSMVLVIAETCQDQQRQSEGTPFLVRPLLDKFGYLGNEEVMYQVMDGSYKPPAGVDHCTIDFLKTLKQSDAVNSLPEIDLMVTPEENAKGWQKMKEKTGSKSGTPGFNHYMCGCKDETINTVDAFL